MRAAIRLHASGACKTKKEAALAVGLSPQTLYGTSAPKVRDPQVRQLYTDIDEMVQDETISNRMLIERLSRKAIGRIAKLMEQTDNEKIQLDAARDLADRGNETSKIQKHQVESFSMSRDDAKGLAEAIAESVRVKQKYAELETQNYIRLEGGLDGQAYVGQADEDASSEGVEATEAEASFAEGQQEVGG